MIDTGKKDASLATKPTTALSAELLAELAKDAGAGSENVRPEDMVIPFVTVLQKNSPQVDDAGGSYIEGAKPGQFFESGTQSVYDTLQVIPCEFKTMMVEWHPRETGGGFVGQHEVGYEKQFQRNDRGQWVTDVGTLLIQTMYFYCLLIQPSGDTMPVVFSFTSSQLKKARTWVTRLVSKKITDPGTGKKFTPPFYEMIWNVSSVAEENEKGTWRGYKIDPLKQVDSLELFQAARKARTMFQQNVVVRPADPTTPEGV
jgi:hypothetical protein